MVDHVGFDPENEGKVGDERKLDESMQKSPQRTRFIYLGSSFPFFLGSIAEPLEDACGILIYLTTRDLYAI